jgi:hypothetical protein
MKTMVSVILLAVLLCGQSLEAGDKTGRLDSIYAHLIKLDTGMFPPEEWTVTDMRVVREILYQVQNSDRMLDQEHRRLPREADRVEVICRKRLRDDEIQTLFLAYMAQTGRDTVVLDDYVFIRGILGQELYRTVQGYRGTGKDDFEADLARVTDIYLNPLEPSVQLWSTQPRGARAYSAVSMFGRLGNEALDLPFWFRGTMVGGLTMTFIDRPSSVRDPDYYLFRIDVGIEEPINFSVPQTTPPSPNSMFKSRKLEGSGTAVFLSGSYTPWTRVPFLGIDTAGFVRLHLEMSVAVQERESFSPRLPETFYSIRNALVFGAEVKRLGVFTLGAGVAWHDVHHFSRVELPNNGASQIEPTVNNVLASFECGIGENGGLLQYDIRTAVHYSLTDGYGFFVVKPVLMLSNNFGFSVSYFKAFRSDNLPPWHYDNYIVFAPIIRINY